MPVDEAPTFLDFILNRIEELSGRGQFVRFVKTYG
jgi:hypothetical protein